MNIIQDIIFIIIVILFLRNVPDIWYKVKKAESSPTLVVMKILL